MDVSGLYDLFGWTDLEPSLDIRQDPSGACSGTLTPQSGPPIQITGFFNGGTKQISFGLGPNPSADPLVGFLSGVHFNGYAVPLQGAEGQVAGLAGTWQFFEIRGGFHQGGWYAERVALG